jgi:hypothetical protein
MIECGIRVRGAKRMGEMLEKNASLMKIDLSGECPLKIPFYSLVIQHSLDENVHPKGVNVHLGWDVDGVVLCMCVVLQGLGFVV